MRAALGSEQPNRLAASIALCLALLVLWLLTHRYQGLFQDAKVYAFQALARLQPAFLNDLYLQNVSQDKFTIFSPIYAGFISALGLAEAARWLTVLFTLWFTAAVWWLARHLEGRDDAWLTCAFWIVAAGSYGSYGIFSYSEDYLSARLPAQALVVTALALHYRGFAALALLVVVAALSIHPLMALPGLLLLSFLMIPTGAGVTLAGAGVAVIAGLSIAVAQMPVLQKYIAVMDAPWVEVVRERSQFLFLPLWSRQDWLSNARPFVSIGVSGVVLSDPRLRKLCIGAAVLGASGLGIAFIASTLTPIAILMQGQAWRWVWVTVLISVVLAVPSLRALWREPKGGALCAVLFAAGWTFPEIDGSIFMLGALAIWVSRARINETIAGYLRWAALGLAAVIIASTISDIASVAASHLNLGGEPMVVQKLRSLASLKLPVLCGFFLLWRLLVHERTRATSMLIAAALLLVAIYATPSAFRGRPEGAQSYAAEFSDWIRAIPPGANVYVANGLDTCTFAWFTLGRPSYLSLDQSAGVVFSRATALEVRRRSQVLMPLMDEDWRLKTKIESSRSTRDNAGSSGPAGSGDRYAAWKIRTLTREGLLSMCRDPHFDFLIARENVGFDPMRHEHSGPFKGWNLYDCAHVRGAGART